MLEQVAASFATTIVAAIQQEYPNDLRHRMDGPGDRPRPGEVHPAFYGCYDWHSAVAMHWALVRLMRLAPEQVPAEAGDVLDDHFADANLATEATYFDSHPGFERPYGWGWALALAEELSNCADPRARRWARAIEPLAARVSAGWLDWLARADYPLRNGMHTNSAFALARARRVRGPSSFRHDPGTALDTLCLYWRARTVRGQRHLGQLHAKRGE